MSPTFKSGAFVQQCFSSHPLCLELKKVNLPERLILKCTSCRMWHGLTLRGITSALSRVTDSIPTTGLSDGADESLTQCATNHPLSLRVWEMDVFEDSVGIRCSECRRAYSLDVSEFESHQK